jgi:hypothetical protein
MISVACLIIIWTCISLMINDVECLQIHVGKLYVFGKMSIHVFINSYLEYPLSFFLLKL